MDPTLRRLEPGDRPAATTLLDDAVGAGFWDFCEGADDISAVAVHAGGLAGIVVAALEPAAFLFAWLPAGRPEPGAVRLYEAAGYTAAPDIPEFYAAGSVAAGARCPYCGPPPCRCAARPFVKAPLEPA